MKKNLFEKLIILLLYIYWICMILLLLRIITEIVYDYNSVTVKNIVDENILNHFSIQKYIQDFIFIIAVMIIFYFFFN